MSSVMYAYKPIYVSLSHVRDVPTMSQGRGWCGDSFFFFKSHQLTEKSFFFYLIFIWLVVDVGF